MLVKIRDFIRKYKQLTFFIFLLIVGIFFTIIGILSLSKPKVEGIEVEATIVDIKKEELGTNADGYTEFSYTVYVDYIDKDDNIHNRIEYPSHSDDMVVGNKILVKYNPNNPNEIVADNSFNLLPTLAKIIGYLYSSWKSLAISYKVVSLL